MTSKESPFHVLRRLCGELKFRFEDFFEQYLKIFEKRFKDKLYTNEQIGGLFGLIGRHDHFFSVYFIVYAANVDFNQLWSMFLYICSNNELNDVVEKTLYFQS